MNWTRKDAVWAVALIVTVAVCLFGSRRIDSRFADGDSFKAYLNEQDARLDELEKRHYSGGEIVSEEEARRAFEQGPTESRTDPETGEYQIRTPIGTWATLKPWTPPFPGAEPPPVSP